MTKVTDLDSSNEENEEIRVRKFAKHMLRSSLFIGTFLEKRYVQPLNSYRDVIKISDEESDLIANIKAVRRRLFNFFGRNVWIGVTEPSTIGAPAGHNLWVILDEEVFGCYWYKIKNVEFLHNEVRLKIEIIRPVREKTPIENVSPSQIFEEISENGLGNIAGRLQTFCNEMFSQSADILKWNNIKQASIFLFLLISTILAFAVQAIQYLLEYTLKLIRELSHLVNACTPIILNFMRMIMAIINGFYNLIAVMWRDRSTTPRVNQNIYQILPPEAAQAQYSGLRALPYRYGYPETTYRYPTKSLVKITPLD